MPISTEPQQRHDAEDHIPSGSSSSFPTLEHFRVKNIPPAAYYIPDFITEEEEAYLLRKVAESPQPKWKKVGSGRRLQYWGGTMSKNGVLLPEPLPEFLTAFPDIILRIESFLSAAIEDKSDVKGKQKALDINQVLVNEYEPGQGISPHEDGPAFQPLVATISLGSHTVLDIHHYLSTTAPSPPMTTSEPIPSDDPTEAGRPIAAIPLAHLLALPRSLLILSSSLYTSHLHAIAPKTKDVVRLERGTEEDGGVVIANAELLGDAEIADGLRDNGSWAKERGVRTSFTFRHAEKVLKGGAFSMAMGGLRRT
ncbi:hypothetical protein CI109_106611 [Kwoniella shandongensis]|uniref:Uncharacterized protein n=1 Tax=Kwoniella shandongensis TaxID=1734106 RepID=A0A5M6BNQ1_9TREE|nr:uncharacterized protein CI109_007153 [Kwoniella shandongensis]KAA5524498.1 hypothetical protein CI109_007153 [Kwoniella shandongensis]